MKNIFYRKRSKDGAQVIRVKGFTDDTGNTKAEIIVSVMVGTPGRRLQRESQCLCDELNEAYKSFYEGKQSK